jgi:glycosyltransferase involved in cell wall biosynthesis
MSISVLILTLNEERNLPACLSAVSWCDDVVVLDQGSTDATCRIAKQAGARVVCHSAGNEREQRTYSIREIPFQHAWVFNPDADEIATPELAEEMLKAVSDPARDKVAYRMRRRTVFMGRWLRYSALYDTWLTRLFQPGRLSFKRTTNLLPVVDGPVGYLQGYFVHQTFNNGMNAWLEKHNRYSWYEAFEALESLNSGGLKLRELFSRDPLLRRRAVKEISFRLPCRPTLRFLYMYLFRRGFLDGGPGFHYCRLLALYEYMIVLKMKEIRRRELGQAV